MSSESSKKRNVRKRIVNADEKGEVVKKRLTEFYTYQLATERLFTVHFNKESIALLGAGVFGHVFQITARKDITFGDLETITSLMTRDEKHLYLNRVEMLNHPNKAEVSIRRGSIVALKIETAYVFQLENFPVEHKNLPEFNVDRYSIYKEFNTLCLIFNRFGYKETRGFTKPYAFGRLGDYTFLHFEGNTKTKMYGFHFMLFELCGPDMEDMLEVCSYNCRQNDQRLSTRTVFLIGDQLISRLQCLQEPSIDLCHNDLKCDQLIAGRGENTNTIFLIDYGLVTRYRDTWDAETVVPVGNKRWAPRSHHQMAPRTLLCEIESACYVLLRLLKNHFPWDGIYDKQVMKLQEIKGRGEDDQEYMSGDQVLLEEKQYLWLYLKKESGRKILQLADNVEQEIEKYRDFFEDRNDRWGDGGSQMLDLMIGLSKLGDQNACSFTERKVDFSEINYMAIRKHLLSIFDLSMYTHTLDLAGLSGPAQMQTQAFFEENRKSKEQRTECGRPVYHYFPEGEQHCYWEWHCRCRDIWENRPEYWQKVLANREELADLLRQRILTNKQGPRAETRKISMVGLQSSIFRNANV